MDERLEAETDTDGLFAKLKAQCLEDLEKVAPWQREARDVFGMAAGDQWTEEDRSKLKEQLRPIITMNQIDPIIDSVSGSEVANRQEVQYLPREQGDVEVNEVLTESAKWFRDQCDAEDEESDAFRDTVICGMGWTETRLDYEDNPDGDPKIERIDPLELVWDSTAKKRNLIDMRRVFHIKRDIPIEEARALCPGDPETPFEDADYHASWITDRDDKNDPNRNDHTHYDDDAKDKDSSKDKKVTLVRAQWYEREPYVRFVDPQNPENIEECSTEEWRAISGKASLMGVELRHMKATRKVYKQAYLGAVVLEIGDAPCEGHFSFDCITGKRDRNKNSWYGLVRGMKDPQQWSNKWLAQTLHIMNTSAKGGIIAERGAFDNDQDAEGSWAKQDVITYAKPGALAANRIQPKPQANVPAGFMQLTEIAMDLLPRTSGVSIETLGMREATQAASLEYQRKQSSMTILQPFFDGLRRYRKVQGRKMLYLIENYLSDGRLVRIVGKEGAKYVPLIKQEGVATYDVIVDSAATSPNQKEATWAFLQQILPVIGKILPPATWLALLKYSPLPTSAQTDIKESIEEAGQQPDPEMQKMEAEFAMKQKSADADIENQKRKTDSEIEAEQRKAQNQMELARRKQINDSLTGMQQNKAATGPDGQLVETGPDQSAVVMSQLLMAVLDKLEASNAPKMIIRDEQGNAVGIGPAQQQAMQ